MIVTFKNTGIIEKAEIRFAGLTVIAGENDTGKSTIGKLMFSLIKTFNRYERDARLYQVRNIQDMTDDYYFEFRKDNVTPSVLEAGKTFFDELKNEVLSLISKELSREETQSVIYEKLKGFIGFVQGLADIQIDIEGLTRKLVNLVCKKPGKEEIFKQTLGKYMGSMFNSEMVNQFTGQEEYFISGKEGKTVIFEISGKNGPGELKLNDRLYFEDATFIESPILLNLADTLRFSKTLFDKNGETKKQAELLEKSYVPEYMKDFMLKLTERGPREQNSGIIANIRDIIKGDFYYDHKENDFVFKKEDKMFKGLSISPGIKYIGSISILRQVGFLNKNSLLIMDEPETHIHPQWQIRFAEVLVKLVKEGSNILLTSHSPYLIEALKLYSDKLLEQSSVNFYISEAIENKCTTQIYDVTHDISPLFDILAEPLDKLEALQ